MWPYLAYKHEFMSASGTLYWSIGLEHYTGTLLCASMFKSPSPKIGLYAPLLLRVVRLVVFRQPWIGWHYFSNATCLIRHRLLPTALLVKYGAN